MFYSIVIISNFFLVPVPLQWIYVVIDAHFLEYLQILMHIFCNTLQIF